MGCSDLIKLLLSFFLLLCIVFTIYIRPVYSNDLCLSNPIYCQILQNKPTMNKNKAMNLSNIIYNASKQYKISSRVLTAIFMQESQYDHTAVSKFTGLLVTPSRFPWEKEKRTKVTINCDFGISQIHIRTLERYGFDANKLITDLKYSVFAGARVLSDIKKRHSKEVNYWSRYNSSSITKRKIYEILVERYL